MKIALVHDYLAQDGGAERVLQAFHDIWPDAPIFVLFHDKKKMERFANADVRESFFAKLPFGRTHYKWYTPWMAQATEGHNLQEYDLVLSSASAFAKGVLTKEDALHISYCHSPTRYLWTDTHAYIEDLRYNRLVKSFLPRFIHRWRMWDNMSANRVDYFIANSGTVQKRISKYYRRNSDIIYPPVDIDQFHIAERVGDYFVSGGRLVPYKRFDLLVKTFNRLTLPLKIFGTGPELDALKAMAKPNITFLGRISDEEKAQLLRRAQAFIHPQVEDLGITPIESMASGRPVIAYPVGGVTETVIPGITGIFFQHQTWESLLDAVLSFDATAWDPVMIRAQAQRYRIDGFKERVHRYVIDRYEEFQQGLLQCQLDVR